MGRRLLLASAAAGALAVIAPFSASFRYLKDLSLWKMYGEEFYRARYETSGPGSREAVFSALGDANVFTRFEDVKARLLDMENQIVSGDIVRHNWLGPAMLADDVMVDGTFSLGMSYENHTLSRKWLDSSLWGSAKRWDERKIAQAAEMFLAGRTHFSLPVDFKEFAVFVQAKEWIGLSSEEFDAHDFAHAYQEWRLQAAVNLELLPKWMRQLPGVSHLITWIQNRNSQYVDAIKIGIARSYPDVPESQRDLLAATALDAFTFAGGLSIGEIGARVVAALFNKLGDLGEEGFILTEENVDQVISETIRLYPAVSNIPYERCKPFARGSKVVGREILGIGPVLHDPELWGPDAMEFRLRGPETYKAEHFVAFLDLNPHRSCPGKDLAMATLRQLILALNKRKWRTEGSKRISFWGYVTLPFGVEIL
eukprot:TRINITY_DN11349_c0_g1_i1.p1 TRINITY_DN11349_c0_g1~~TRINITY_DN11349_c0_g1_i1.p1  ORF type:complete len:425 (-),score=77.58 TRINITY_DN11349_c0_g1_i1:50-1324(-)